jgi:hypothetical protein
MLTTTIEHLDAAAVDVSLDIGPDPESLVLILSHGRGVAVRGTPRELRELAEDIRSAVSDPALAGDR